MSAQQAYLTIVYRITHPSQPKALFEQAEWSAASHSHAIHDRDRLEGQRDILLEALRSVWLWMENQADGQSKGGHATFDLMLLREQRDIARAAIAKATGETK